jgi:hypothetical protein
MAADRKEIPAVCDCRWQGMCIFNEYLQNNSCIKCQQNSVFCDVQMIKWYEEDLVVIRLNVPRGIAEWAALPGSFVFLRAETLDAHFDMPVSVMSSDYESATIDLAVKLNGPKSKGLIGNGKTSVVEMRGIYRNGLLGAEKLMNPDVKRVLCLAKGVGIAPVANYVRWAGNNTHIIDVIVDTDKINKKLVEDAVCIDKVNSLIYGCLPKTLSWAEQEKYDVIVLSASEYFQKSIYIPENKRVLSNNHTMCCGEGICGACVHSDSSGGLHRMCKACRTCYEY